jgi:hypothetical protein
MEVINMKSTKSKINIMVGMVISLALSILNRDGKNEKEEDNLIFFFLLVKYNGMVLNYSYV